MSYTAKTANQLRNEAGTTLEKLVRENAEIQDTLMYAERKYVNLTAFSGTNTALQTTGIDLASGSDITVHGHFFPTPVTLVAMYDLITEAYVKDTDDAKIEVYDGDGEKLFGRTLTASGEDVGEMHTTLPEAGKERVTFGTLINLKAVNTKSGSGTGHAIVIVEYRE